MEMSCNVLSLPLCSVSSLFKMKYYHLQLNKAKYPVLPKAHASPTFIGSHWVSLGLIDFKEEETGTMHVASATSKCVPFGIIISYGAISLPSFNSIASLLVEIFLILCHTTVLALTCIASVSVEQRAKNGVSGVLPARKMGQEQK